MRNTKNDFDIRIAVCIYNAAKYIIDKYRDLEYTGIGKTHLALQENIYSIRYKDIGWLINRYLIYIFQQPSNTKTPLEPIVVE